MDLLREIGDRIREQRERIGWSQQALADRMGVRDYTVCRWERGKLNLTVRTIYRLAREMECDAHVLLPRSPAR